MPPIRCPSPLLREGLWPRRHIAAIPAVRWTRIIRVLCTFVSVYLFYGKRRVVAAASRQVPGHSAFASPQSFSVLPFIGGHTILSFSLRPRRRLSDWSPPSFQSLFSRPIFHTLFPSRYFPLCSPRYSPLCSPRYFSLVSQLAVHCLPPLFVVSSSLSPLRIFVDIVRMRWTV